MGIVEHTVTEYSMIVKRYGREVFDIHKGYIDVTILFNKMFCIGANSVINESAVGYGVKVYKDLTDTEKEAILVLVENPTLHTISLLWRLMFPEEPLHARSLH